MDALQRTLADVVFPVRLIRTVTFLQNLAFRWDVLLTTPAINVSLVIPILVPVFPADLMPIVPVALAIVTPGTKSATAPAYLIHPAAADVLLTKPVQTVAA